MELGLGLAGLVIGLALGFVIFGRHRHSADRIGPDSEAQSSELREPAAGSDQKEHTALDPGGAPPEPDDGDDPLTPEKLLRQENEDIRQLVEQSSRRIEELESRVRRYRRWAGLQMTRTSEVLEHAWRSANLPDQVHLMDRGAISGDVIAPVRELAQPLQTSMEDVGTDEPEVYHWLGMWHALEGRSTHAAEAFEGAVRNGLGARAWLALGDSLWNLERRKKARSAYQQCLNLDHSLPPEIRRRCAQVAFEDRSYAEALEALKPLFNLEHAPVEVFTLASRAASRLHDHERAISICETGLVHHADSAVLLSAKIVPLAELGKTDEVEQTYYAARAIDLELADAPLAMGVAQVLSGSLDDAEEHLSEALELDSSTAQAHFYLGVIHNRKGEFKDALEHFHRAVEVEPNYAEAYYNMKDSYDGLRDFENSIAVLKRAVELNPEYE